MPATYDTIVIGLGAMGSAALYQLAKRGKRVLGIDRYNPPHTYGSSHGGSRITRQAIGEGLEYTPLSLRSYEIVREIEKQTGEKLLLPCGGLLISNKEGLGTHHIQNFFDNTVNAARQYNIAHDILEAKDIKKRFPVFNVDSHEYGYYEPEAGLLYPETCLRTQLDLAQSLGATVLTDETVQTFSDTNGSVKVKTDRGRYQAEQLIVSAGPWLPELLRDSHQALAAHFTVVRQVMFWFDIKENYENFKPGNFPIFIWEGRGDFATRYGMPAIDGPEGGFKIASPSFNEVVNPDTVNRTASGAEAESLFQEQIARCFPSVQNKCLRSAVCMYTDTHDSRFVIGRLPGLDSVLIASPCSGHGFKHSPAIGECLAELVTSGTSKIDLSGFAIERAIAAV